MNQLEPYLFFNGNCADAMHFYEKVLGGKVEMMMKASEAPGGMEKPGSKADGILHAAISVDGQRLLASDWMSPDPYPGINGVSLSLVYQTVDEATRRFNALAERRHSADAAFKHILGRVLRHAEGPVRRGLDGERRQAGQAGIMLKGTFPDFRRGNRGAPSAEGAQSPSIKAGVPLGSRAPPFSEEGGLAAEQGRRELADIGAGAGGERGGNSQRSCAAHGCAAPARRSLPNAARAAAGRCNREPARRCRPRRTCARPGPCPSRGRGHRLRRVPARRATARTGNSSAFGLPSGPVTFTTASTSSSRSRLFAARPPGHE